MKLDKETPRKEMKNNLEDVFKRKEAERKDSNVFRKSHKRQGRRARRENG